MKKVLLTLALGAAVVALGSSDDTGVGGSGGLGGSDTGPITWTGSNLSIIRDDCGFLMHPSWRPS
jgi:hypothetical protein